MNEHEKAAHADVPDVKKSNSAHVGKCAVLFLLSGFWLLTTVNNAYREFSDSDKLLILSWVGLICVLQILFLLMIIKIKFSEWACNIFFATFAVINLFCLYLFFFTAYDSLPRWFKPRC